MNECFGIPNEAACNNCCNNRIQMIVNPLLVFPGVFMR